MNRMSTERISKFFYIITILLYENLLILGSSIAE